MTLPVIDKPVFDVTILSQKAPIKITPFTVKESKILMMAKEADDVKSIIDAVRQVLQNCLVDKGIDVKSLPMVDLEVLYLHIHARSFGEKLPLFFTCQNQVPDIKPNTASFPQAYKECGMVIKHEVDLLNVKVKNSNHEKRVMLTDKIGVEMKYPTYEGIQKMLAAEDDATRDILLTAKSIDFIFTETEVIHPSQMREEELTEWVEALPSAKYDQMEAFLKDTPTISQEIEATCSKCGKHHKVTLEGLEDFFV